MPHLRQVSTLHTLCLKSIGTLVVNLPSQIAPDIQGDWQLLQQNIGEFGDALGSYVPWCLYDLVAVEVLKAIKNLIKEEKCSYRLVINMAKVILDSKLKRLDFSGCPEIIRPVLYENLFKMNGLESLIIRLGFSEWHSLNRNTKILKAFKVMTNLRSVCLRYDCNDEIVQVISENCLNIRSIDVTLSKSVTDQSVQYFLKCRQLIYLQLGGTSVTRPGHARLISKLPHLKYIGYCDTFDRLAMYMSQKPYNNIQRIMTEHFSAKTLGLLAQFFPKLESLSLIFNVRALELTELVHFKCLKELLIAKIPKWLQSYQQTFEIFGHQLVHVHLEDSNELSLDSLTEIGNCCPNLTSLVIYRVKFENSYNIVNRVATRLKPQSFSKLKKLFWSVKNTYSATLLQLILSKAVRIKYLHVGSSTGIQHLHIVNVLRVNRMKYLKELKVLNSTDMNMQTVELLLASCPNLTVLSELRRWEGISEHELIEFENFIKKSNFDLDISPIRLSLPRCCESLLTFNTYLK